MVISGNVTGYLHPRHTQRDIVRFQSNDNNDIYGNYDNNSNNGDSNSNDNDFYHV